MKFRVRIFILASAASVACLLFLFLEPRFGWISGDGDMDNDYVDVVKDGMDGLNEETQRMITDIQNAHVVKKSLFPFAFEADIFNASAREAMIERFLAWYDVRWDFQPAPGTDLWEVAAGWVTPEQIHGEYTPELGAILLAMTSRRILSADVGHKGTQLKLTLVLEGGQSVVFKPQWYDRNFVIEGKPYEGHDRHNGEIVAFHLNRLLGYRRVPLTVGRVIDLEKEILPVATERLKITFFKNGSANNVITRHLHNLWIWFQRTVSYRNRFPVTVEGSNTCFYGKCLYCKGESNGVCAKGTVMEGTVILMLPKKFQYQKYRHPWGRTYREGRKARWEYDDDHYCADVQKMPMYGSGRLLLDFLDACVFDYIVGNADRHHFEVFENETESILIMFDNGKSFGNPFQDEESILAPLKQCKRIRYGTVQRLRQMRRGVLSKVLGDIMSRDPVAPLLTSHHMRAMERRLEYVVQLIEKYTDADSKALVEKPFR